MKQRLLTGWNIGRILYLLIGIYVIVATVSERHWFGVVIGGYFVAMAIFRFGCAAGNCYTSSASSYKLNQPVAADEVHYEEVK